MNNRSIAFAITMACTTADPDAPSFVEVSGFLAVNLEVENDAANAVNSMRIQAKDHADGEWYDFIKDTDWTAGAVNNVLFVSSTLPSATGANGGKTHAHIRVNGCRFIRFMPTLASSTGNVTVRGNGAVV